MRFIERKRRQPPAVIIVSLIDVLIVVLIFLMVTTSFKQQKPAVKLTLPESKQGKAGASEDAPVIITIAKQEPYFYLANRPVTLDKLQAELIAGVAKNPNVAVSIRADEGSPWGKVVNVMDAAKVAKVKAVSAFTKSPPNK